jgi:tetratricopeptide (TPR) repeat protein
MKIIEDKIMPNIKKLIVIVILPLMFSNKVIAETNKLLDQDIKTKQQHELDQQSKIKEPNILVEEYFNIGRSFLRLKKYQKAVENFDLAIKHKADYAEAYCNKGLALNELDKHQEAIKNYDLATKYHHNHIMAYYNKAYALNILGDR